MIPDSSLIEIVPFLRIGILTEIDLNKVKFTPLARRSRFAIYPGPAWSGCRSSASRAEFPLLLREAVLQQRNRFEAERCSGIEAAALRAAANGMATVTQIFETTNISSSPAR